MAASIPRGLVFLLSALLLAALVAPAAAQEPTYPPDPPEDPEGSIECDIMATPDALVLVCTGEGLAPGSRVEVEVTLGAEPPTAQGEIVLASGPIGAVGLAGLVMAQDAPDQMRETGTVSDDGTVTVHISIPCDEDRLAHVRAEGEDSESGAVIVSNDVFDLSEYECPRAPDGDDDSPPLPRTGLQIGLLVVLALGLIGSGYAIMRRQEGRA